MLLLLPHSCQQQQLRVDGWTGDWLTVDIAACLRAQKSNKATKATTKKKLQREKNKNHIYETQSAFAVCAFKFFP